MAIVNLTAMSALADAADADVLYIVDDPASSALPRKITYQNIVRRAYGEISVTGGTTAQSISATTFTKLTCFDTNGLSKGTTNSHANDKITVTDAGVYFVELAASYSTSDALTADLCIYYNGSATQGKSCITTLANFCASTSINSIVNVASGSTDFEAYVYLSGASNITVKHAALSVLRIA